MDLKDVLHRIIDRRGFEEGELQEAHDAVDASNVQAMTPKPKTDSGGS